VLESVFERRAEETVTIHLPAAEVEVVKRLAKAKGMEHTALIQEWVREKLQHA
jgi:predicted DNA binding CopG/RHH family protein